MSPAISRRARTVTASAKAPGALDAGDSRGKALLHRALRAGNPGSAGARLDDDLSGHVRVQEQK